MRISDWSSDVCSSDLGRVDQISVGAAVPGHRQFPELAFVGAAARIGEDDRQGDLAVAKIVADALAHRLGVGDIVDRVVDELKGDAEIAAEGVEIGNASCRERVGQYV